MIESIKEIDIEILSVLIGIAGTLVVTGISIFVKDFVLEILKEKRTHKQSQLSTFKHYANPVIKSSETLCWRLREILSQKGAVLLDSNSKNEFFRYKYISTLYRICAVIGWLTAIKKEYAYIDPASKKSSAKIEDALYSFRKSLADGQHMELSILIELTEIWNINIDSIDQKEKALLAVHIEKIAYSYIDKHEILTAKDLDGDEQSIMLKEISNKICSYVKCPKLSKSLLKETKERIITELSRIEAWIYRDWQNAIGEVMLSTIQNGTRRFDIIDYGTFESLYNNEERWIQRVERLVADLDVSIDEKYDARINQLKNIYASCIELIEAFDSVNKQSGTIREESFNQLIKFKNSLTAT